MNSFTKIVDNVGPNGESAYEFSFPSGGVGIRQDVSTSKLNIFGVYVRTSSGTTTGRVEFSNGDAGPATTIGTEWTWVKGTTAGDSDSVTFIVNESATIYILRAGLNRGSSLEYSTRSKVPQTIPDVIQGADLTNGTDPGADTNGLDFAVDGSGVPYAVGDGNDETSTLPQDGTETWATRVYIPSSVGADVEFLGDTGYAYPTLVYDDANGDLRLRYKDSGGTTQQGPRVSATEGSWVAVAVTVDGSDLRLHVGGTVDEQTGTELSISADPRLLGTQSGARVQGPEQHPVLSESEAEAVRQRLAGNPPDPVPVTEAWDFTFGSGGTLPAFRQSSNDLTIDASTTWFDPIGLSDSGGGTLSAPTKRPQVTRVHRVKSTQGPLMGRSANGWYVTPTALVAEDTSGNTATSAHEATIDDGAFHTLAVVIDTVADTAKLYVDASATPAATVDLSTIGTLKSGDVNLLPFGGTLTHAPYMTRVLSGEEIAYVSQAIKDNPNSAFPNYTTP